MKKSYEMEFTELQGRDALRAFRQRIEADSSLNDARKAWWRDRIQNRLSMLSEADRRAHFLRQRMKERARGLVTDIENEQQAFVDQRVHVNVKPAALHAFFAVNQRAAEPIVFGEKPPEVADQHDYAPPQPIQTDEYERVRLRWMKPDGKGGVVPRDEQQE
jgi:hypothetical protein